MPDAYVTILLAPPGPLAGIRDSLQDWSALGLVSDFVWIERGELKSAGETPAVRIEAGRATATTLERELRSGWSTCRVGVLVPGLAGVTPVSEELEDHVVRRAVQAGGQAKVVQVRCLVTRPRSGPWSGNPSRPEWHNVLISPEDRSGPTRGYQTLDPSSDAIDIGPHAAAVVAGVLGLWDGIDASPLDTQAKGPARNVRLARSFYRRLDANEVESQIRDRVTSTADGLPRPSAAGNGSRYVDDAAEATRRMSEEFWRKHGAVLTSGELEPDLPEAGALPAWEAIKMFFGFLWATILRGPERWYQAMVGEVSRRLAEGLQRSIFGPGESEYAVVVGRMRGDQTGWQDLSQASDRLGQLVTAGNPELTALPALPGKTPQPGAWRDLVDVALTLADAGDRPTGIAPLQANIERLVVRRPADIAPGAEAAFDELPTGITAPAGGLRPADTFQIAAIRRQLSQPGPDGRPVEEAQRSLAALDRWQRQYEGAFTVRVGRRLAEAVARNADDVARLLERLRAARDVPPLDTDLLRRQRRLIIFMRVLFALMIVAVGVLVYCGASDRIEDSTAVWGSIAAVLVWLVGTATAFAAQQRNLFAELNRRRRGIAQAEIDRRNLQIRLEDLRQTTQAYGEFLEWSRVIAVVVREPFPALTTGGSPMPVIGEGMPASTKIGVARPSESAIEEMVEELRTNQYEFGWLTPVWQRVLLDAAPRLGPRARRLRGDDKALMYAEPSGSDDLLSAWADELERGGIGSGAGDELWQQAMTALEASGAARALITEVVVADGGTQSLTEFKSDIGESPVASLPFDPDTLVELARVQGKAAVDVSWPGRERRSGLGWGAITVELSAAVPVWDLVGADVRDPAGPDQPLGDPDDDIDMG